MSSAMSIAPVKPSISMEVLNRIDVRVGRIEAVQDVPGSDKLVRLRVGFGDHTRTIVAGLKHERANPRDIEGKQALFVGVIHAYSPMDQVSQAAAALSDEPPDVVMPELARTVYRVVAGPHAPGIGLLRAVFFEVGTLSPDAEAAARELATTVFASVGAYVMKQMQAGTLRMVHPILALQSFVGPIFFHLVTRPMAERVLGLNMEGEAAVTALAEGWLRSMKPD